MRLVPCPPLRPTDDVDAPEAPAYGDPITDVDKDPEPPEPVAEPEYGVPISATPKPG